MKRKEFTVQYLMNIPRIDIVLEHGLFSFLGIKYIKKIEWWRDLNTGNLIVCYE